MPLNGWLILDKPIGLSSAHAVSRVKKWLKVAKLGHAGTLDPLASGVLPLALGEATKLVSYAMDGIKTYQFSITFGEARDTDDAEGVITATHTHIPTISDIHAILPQFTGKISQTPPRYSALNVGGKRAYALARAGKSVELQPRIVNISNIILLKQEGATATLEVTCGKGTYVRSLARDMAESLGTCGYVSMLRRTKVGKFDINHSILLDKLEEMVHTPPRYDFILPVDTVLDGIPVLVITEDCAIRVQNGQSVPLPLATELSLFQGVAPVRTEKRLVALGEIMGGYIKPVRVFNL